MEDKLYQPEPIPHRARAARSRDAMTTRHATPRTPMNGTRPDAQEAIARILEDDRFQNTVRSATRQAIHVGNRINASSPTTPASPARDLFSASGRQPTFELPERYREMRAISRWEAGEDGRPGRWLSEAELFFRQGTFMADFEDNCPYTGLFKSYFPTYNAMSDRQLRGYFTWRAAVRRDDVQETSLSFAYVYLYELINGIGITEPLDGFRKIEAFWQTYRAFAPELDRYVNVWLQDYAVYHGLDPQLLEPYKTLAFDRALIALRKADEEMVGAAAVGGAAVRALAGPAAETKTGRRGKRGESAIPLPPDAAREEQLFQAIDALSTYRLTGSRFYREQPDALRHVACAVFARMDAHRRKQRASNLLKSWFGEEVTLPYTMFGSAVFFDPVRHADAVYELDEIHRYRCEHGLWTCERVHGNRSRSPQLGEAMRAVDRSLHTAYDSEYPLKEDKKTPKYLQGFIDREVEAWRSWETAHAPVQVDIDLSRLAGIRRAAAQTRESLLIDEEREGGGALVEAAGGGAVAEGLMNANDGAPMAPAAAPASAEPAVPATPATPDSTAGVERGGIPKDMPVPEPLSALSTEHIVYLRALLDGDDTARRAALEALGTSEDLLVDTLNETLFDTVGDTVIEYGLADGTPQLIEDYREDVEGFLNYE